MSSVVVHVHHGKARGVSLYTPDGGAAAEAVRRALGHLPRPTPGGLRITSLHDAFLAAAIFAEMLRPAGTPGGLAIIADDARDWARRTIDVDTAAQQVTAFGPRLYTDHWTFTQYLTATDLPRWAAPGGSDEHDDA